MDATEDWGEEPEPFRELANKTVGYQSLTDIPTATIYNETEPLTMEVSYSHIIQRDIPPHYTFYLYNHLQRDRAAHYRYRLAT